MPRAKTRERTADVLRHSRFAQRALAAQPALCEEIEANARRAWSPEAMRAFLVAQAIVDEPGLRSALRQLRQRVILRLMARDLSRRADLAEVCATTSALAEIAIETALGFLEQRLEAELGVPKGESGRRQRLIVVGMGKLGGGELNVSSDIDLIFVYPEEGETQAGNRRASLSNHEFFTRLGRRLIGVLTEPTAEGLVFRVDMRLRPWGDSGPLATSFDALEQYLVAQGREWERYAWIKARALTGDQAEALGAIVRPFVFRKYLDYGAFAAMRDLHAQIRAEVARLELADHVKLGPGGIREIEFIAQAFQLIRGGRDASLRVRPTLEVLALLAAKRLIPPEAEAELRDAYVFLRSLEHRLQYLEDAQTHSLPEAPADRALIAESMGHRSWESFAAALEEHRRRVARHFGQVFSTQEDSRHSLAPLWHGELDGDALERLGELGYARAAEIEARLRAIRSSNRYADQPTAIRQRFDQLIPRIIELAAARANPDDTLERCLTLIEVIGRRAAYLALLDEHPQALAKLAELVSVSSWAADYLNRHPIVLDELLDARALAGEPDWNEFAQALRRSLMDDDPERQMDLLRESHHAQVFRLLVADLNGALSVERLADHLSDLADVMLQVTLELCWTQLRARHCERPSFAVIGYGKLGGKELGYASDLDIIFLYDDAHEAAPETYARLAQRMNNWLTARTGAGVLFDTDLRLRPNGEGGLMVSSLDAFRRYQRESAWVWEHQALTRARYCAGEAAVGAAFETVRREILRSARDPAKLREEVLAMRRRMHEAHPNKSDLFDLKHDAGGMVDIEFMVQYLVLAHAARHPELTRNDGNIALLSMAAGLAGLGLIAEDASERVREAYRVFGRLQHALRLNGARHARVPSEEVAGPVAATRALWRAVFG
ncbi:MAG: bifunctional [glutamate--ammonia ligase]-adenylyl-L-tyrosine phosphorylase/[glutamate--ammonia-ligase] adenylyltransferase [Betaproteobacteria bacterium]|nr:bifunctional [glutamate--ammonia ligase]-adenylyl-L-tyrosine phosphorylase/[glutamate--ammonia-ligase] adenylyltransferase [Betaproteobacteria bacterium]